MPIYETISELYPNRVVEPNTLNDIPTNQQLVYILCYNDSPIVVGIGKKNRAKIIFDDQWNITNSHVKALFVRLYILYGEGGIFDRYIICCDSRDEAKKIENSLHQTIGGNTRILPENIKQSLFDAIPIDSIPWLLLNFAIRSSFDGISDLRKWRRDNLISDNDWNIISQRLQLE